LKVRDRRSYAFALVSVAAMIDVQAGKIHDVRVALGGVAHKPWRVPAAEQQMIGKEPGPAAYGAAADAALKGARTFPHNAFKVELAKRSIVRALTLAAARGETNGNIG
jgi:xanthine dehydrogenase YagS FAD-binding subunit